MYIRTSDTIIAIGKMTNNDVNVSLQCHEKKHFEEFSSMEAQYVFQNRVVVACSEDYPEPPGLEGIRRELLLEGISLSTGKWEDETVDWTSYDMVLLLGVFSYVKKCDEFIKWLDQLEAKNVRGTSFKPCKV